MTIACLGIGVDSGIGVAIGNAYRLRLGPTTAVAPSCVPKQQIEKEVHRFTTAVTAAAAQLREIRDQIPASTPSDIVEFIDTHLLMLGDKAIAEGPIDLIRDAALSAEWALQLRRDALVRVFEEMTDPYLRTRKDDVDHVVGRIQKLLSAEDDEDFDQLEGRVALADELTPADAILLGHRGVAGFVTEFGGPMSHTAILARSLNIPAIVGARGSMQLLKHGEPLILDARHGVVLAGFDTDTQRYFEDARDAVRSHYVSLRRLGPEPAVTRDGQHLELLANIELPEDVAMAKQNGAQGVGLYRTEFLYMNRPGPPGEDEHFEAYRAVVEGMNGAPVTVRTLDLGADKQAAAGMPVASATPALGLRAIRLCLKEPELCRTQLRALLRASALGPLRIMLPMLTNVWEAMQARALIEDCMHEMAADGIAFDPNVPIGGMIEVPAAALAAASFCRHLDFLSIGTNDLIQYTLAIDRIDDEVNYLYDPAHPAVLRLIQLVILAGQNSGIPIGMCGEMAGDVRFIPLLIGMGLRTFSMQPNSLLTVKETVRECHLGDLQRRITRLMKELDAADVDDVLATFAQA